MDGKVNDIIAAVGEFLINEEAQENHIRKGGGSWADVDNELF